MTAAAAYAKSARLPVSPGMQWISYGDGGSLGYQERPGQVQWEYREEETKRSGLTMLEWWRACVHACGLDQRAAATVPKSQERGEQHTKIGPAGQRACYAELNARLSGTSVFPHQPGEAHVSIPSSPTSEPERAPHVCPDPVLVRLAVVAP